MFCASSSKVHRLPRMVKRVCTKILNHKLRWTHWIKTVAISMHKEILLKFKRTSLKCHLLWISLRRKFQLEGFPRGLDRAWWRQKMENLQFMKILNKNFWWPPVGKPKASPLSSSSFDFSFSVSGLSSAKMQSPSPAPLAATARRSFPYLSMFSMAYDDPCLQSSAFPLFLVFLHCLRCACSCHILSLLDLL